MGGIMKILVKALLILILIISAIHVSAYLATGIWQIGFDIGSGSMEPNMHIGDLILVQSLQRTNIITYEDGKTRAFNEYGDVIAFYPMGNSKSAPIIHRAMYYVDEGTPMWYGGPPAPYAGYITKGDNNRTNIGYDQQVVISHNQPIKKEWIIAVARARVPYAGYLSSNAVGTVLIYAVIYVIILLLLRRKEKHC